MKEFEYVLTDENGIHARPAGMLVKEAAKFNSTIQVKKGAKSADAKRLFALMGLAAKKGDTLGFVIEGEDEDTAEDSIKKFLAENL